MFIANFELRALEAANYAKIKAMRRAYEGKLIAILDAGAASGEFRISDAPITAYAILAMLTGACTWYKPDGRLGKADVVALHTEMVLNGCIRSALSEANATSEEPPAAAPAGLSRHVLADNQKSG